MECELKDRHLLLLLSRLLLLHACRNMLRSTGAMIFRGRKKGEVNEEAS